MKLRLQANSVRLRLKRGEVEQLARTGRVEEKIVFGPDRDDTFHYVLEVSTTVKVPEARCENRRVVVQVPAAAVAHWAASGEVGMEGTQSLGEQGRLEVLIEKDFACLNGPVEQNADTFPNPLAVTKC